MTDENLEVVRRMYQAYHGGDAEEALSYFTPDVVSDHSRRLGGGVAHGREGLRQQIIEWVGTFEGFREEINELSVLGGHVLVVVTQRGRGKGSGAEVTNTYALLYEMKDGMIAALTAYPTRVEALKAAGQQE